MGKESSLRTIRRQLRNVVQQELDKVLTVELVANIKKDLGARMDTGLATLNKLLSDKLNEIDARSKDIQTALVKDVLSKPLDATSSVVPLPVVEVPVVDASPQQE